MIEITVELVHVCSSLVFFTCLSLQCTYIIFMNSLRWKLFIITSEDLYHSLISTACGGEEEGEEELVNIQVRSIVCNWCTIRYTFLYSYIVYFRLESVQLVFII